jgi:hypothetical protein
MTGKRAKGLGGRWIFFYLAKNIFNTSLSLLVRNLFLLFNINHAVYYWRRNFHSTLVFSQFVSQATLQKYDNRGGRKPVHRMRTVCEAMFAPCVGHDGGCGEKAGVCATAGEMHGLRRLPG